MSTNIRHYSFLDRCIETFDQSLRTLIGNNIISTRTNPASSAQENPLTVKEQRHSAGLMRVDHTGEICAQALYQAQAITAREPSVREKMQQSAQEENDHLAWCAQRLQELNSHASYLNPFWYFGSLFIGIVAGLAGDRYSLGFMAETERQVVIHLQKHLQALSPADKKSQKILEQMCADEAHHASVALETGAEELPDLIKQLMRVLSKIMTTTAYWV